MKRGLAVLLATVVGCGAAMAQASAPSLKINGYTNVGTIAAKQSDRRDDKGGSPGYININCSDLGFTVSGISSSGLEYKYRVVMEAMPNVETTVTKNYVEFGGDFGVIQAGALKGPEDTMPFNALSLVGGGGGIDGSFPGIYNFSSGVVDGVYQAGCTSKANKLVFYSPIVNGFQLGIAYTPETNSWGGKLSKNDNKKAIGGDIYPKAGLNGPRGRNNCAVGLKYNGETGAWTYGGAVVWIREQNYLNASDSTLYRTKIRSTNSYSLSTFVGRDSWKLAAGWFDNGKSKLPRDPNTTYMVSSSITANLGNTHQGDAGKAWNFGGQYTVGAYEMAVTYFNTKRKTDATQKATSDVVTFSLDYKALEGLKFFGEVDLIRTKTNRDAITVQQSALGVNSSTKRATGSNSGTVMVAGTKLSF